MDMIFVMFITTSNYEFYTMISTTYFIIIN